MYAITLTTADVTHLTKTDDNAWVCEHSDFNVSRWPQRIDVPQEFGNGKPFLPVSWHRDADDELSHVIYRQLYTQNLLKVFND